MDLANVWGNFKVLVFAEKKPFMTSITEKIVWLTFLFTSLSKAKN